ncbi:MAG TPA: hypothetical protein VIV60_35690, partial [Polyangiaceae bacterium]
SLWVSLDAYQLVNYTLSTWTGFEQRTGTGRILPGATIAAANVVLMVVPLGMAWQHEEWHKAVLSMRSIESRVERNRVAGVLDDDLARLKRRHPAELVRHQTAGIEGGYEFVTTLEKEQFFRHLRTWSVPTIWSFYGMNAFYMQLCASKLSDDDAEYFKSESNPMQRDTIGADCTGWTYDLFHPDEPYSARGPHPSGNGVRRYRTWSELGSRERRYLWNQRNLALLNFLDPMLLGFDAFELGDMRFNAHVRHLPTAFGHEVSLDGFFELRKWKLFLSAQQFFNYQHWFPGVAAQLYRYPFPIAADRSLSVSATGNLWLQPEGQRFFTSRPELGGMLRARLDLSGPRTLEPFMEVDAKTSGWVAGIGALEPSMSLRLGVGLPLY